MHIFLVRLKTSSYDPYIWALDARKPVFGGLRTAQTQTSSDADQPAHPRSLISASAIRVLESTISKLATGKISVF